MNDKSTDHKHHGHQEPHHDNGHGGDHKGHETIFRRRFWWSTLLSLPVLFLSPTIQTWLGYTAPTFPGSQWIPLVFSLIVFAVGGIPFINMAVPEIQDRKPGMMTLISLAISVALIYSLATQLFDLGAGFFWELVTLIDVMLLGHWLEMRSVRQASGALNELAKLMPDTTHRIKPDGETEEISADKIQEGDLLNGQTRRKYPRGRE